MVVVHPDHEPVQERDVLVGTRDLLLVLEPAAVVRVTVVESCRPAVALLCALGLAAWALELCLSFLRSPVLPPRRGLTSTSRSTTWPPRCWCTTSSGLPLRSRRVTRTALGPTSLGPPTTTAQPAVVASSPKRLDI